MPTMSEPEADAQEIPTIFDTATCVRRGLCPVTQARNGSAPVQTHSIYFEQHGSGPDKIFFMTG